MSSNSFRLHTTAKIHFASDQSGVLVYSAETGNSFQYAAALIPLFKNLSTQSVLTQDEIDSLVSEISDIQPQNLCHTLQRNSILQVAV